MSQAALIQPDLAFTQNLMRLGGEDVSKCMQCATCSAVCELSPCKNPFPRKEIIWSQWGLRDRLLKDPDIWLCHNCGDCSVRCPRRASPGTVLSALRHQAILHYSAPRFLANWLDTPSRMPLLVLLPALILALALLIRKPVENALGLSEHLGTGMQYADLFPHWLLITLFTGFLALSLVSMGIGGFRFWQALSGSIPESGKKSRSLVSSVGAVISDLLSHRQFGECTATSARRGAHLLIFYGFLILFLVSAWAVILLYVLNPLLGTQLSYPFNFWNPAKVFANIGAIALIGGCLIAAVERLANTKAIGKSLVFDWLFLSLVLLVGVTGLITELLRFMEWATLGYSVYFVHLVFAFMLLIYLPFSKFAHAIYRFLAMVFAEYTGRREQSRESLIETA